MSVRYDGTLQNLGMRIFADECITLDELKSICENGNIEEKLRSVESLFMSLDYLAVSSAQAKRFETAVR